MSVFLHLLPAGIRFYYDVSFFFFFNDKAAAEIYTLSLHDALPIWVRRRGRRVARAERRHEVRRGRGRRPLPRGHERRRQLRSEEHTSELQSRRDLVCRLLLEKKKK